MSSGAWCAVILVRKVKVHLELCAFGLTLFLPSCYFETSHKFLANKSLVCLRSRVGRCTQNKINSERYNCEYVGAFLL